MNKLILNKDNRYIEICELPEEDLAGKTKIRMSALKIHDSNEEHNDNGLNWQEQFISDNLKSIIGSPYVVSWLDEENQIPSDHGKMEYDDNGNLIFEGVAVGSIQDAYITTVDIDGVDTKVLMTEGYIFRQRYSKFVDWLKYEVENGKVYGSIEINGKGKSKTIEYLDGSTNEDGSLKVPRTPTIFDFTALAILYIVDPADRNSVVFEINSKEGEPPKMSIVNKGVTIEMNKLSGDDIFCLITRAFNIAMGVSEYCSDYYIRKFYPIDSQVVFTKWNEPGSYFMTSYKVENSKITINEILQVEEDWKPISDSQPVEVNINKIKEIITNKGGKESMTIEELNAKIAELNAQLTELNIQTTELNSANVEKDAKIAELTETLVDVNKSLEEVNAKYSTLEVECNGYKEEKVQAEVEKKKVEINTYFETEIPKNNFEEVEVNSLKEYVEKCDLEGLKNAEANLIVKKFKEGKLTVETNSKKEEENNIFFSTKEEKLGDIEAGKSLFM